MSKEYTTLSQKFMNASAARYVIFWLAQLLSHLLQNNPDNLFLQLLGCGLGIFSETRAPFPCIQTHKPNLFRCTCISVRLRAGVCLALSEMEKVMLQHDRVLPDEAVASFRYHYLIYRAGYNRLSEEALTAGQCRWPQRPKMHYLEHLAYDVSPLNGRYLHNFLNEDFVRRVKLLASTCQPAFLSKQVVFKYTLQCCMRWR